jgi:hypothetical protein
MMNYLHGLKQKQAFLRILIFSLVTVIIWVGLSIFRTQQQTSVSSELQKLSEPLNPNINTTVLDRIEQKRVYSAEELTNFTIYRIVVDKNGKEEIVTELKNDTPDLFENITLSSESSPNQVSSASATPIPLIVSPVDNTASSSAAPSSSGQN